MILLQIPRTVNLTDAEVRSRIDVWVGEADNLLKMVKG